LKALGFRNDFASLLQCFIKALLHHVSGFVMYRSKEAMLQNYVEAMKLRSNEANKIRSAEVQLH